MKANTKIAPVLNTFLTLLRQPRPSDAWWQPARGLVTSCTSLSGLWSLTQTRAPTSNSQQSASIFQSHHMKNDYIKRLFFFFFKYFMLASPSSEQL